MISKLVMQKLTIAGKEYEYPDTTALVGKINELADAVNKLETMAKNTNTVLGTLVTEYVSITEATNKTNVPYSRIWGCCNNRHYKSASETKWRYKY